MLLADIHTLMAALANERPIFHSEADFQHAFAWEMQRRWPEARIRLEQALHAGERRIRVDITAYDLGQPVAIELKYPKGLLNASVSGEEYQLSLGVADLTLYDYIRDLTRIERLAQAGFDGFAVMLTNDPTHWTANDRANSAPFRLPERRVLEGSFAWERGANLQFRGYESPLAIAGRYTVEWHEYSTVQGKGRGEFRYLALHLPAVDSR